MPTGLREHVRRGLAPAERLLRKYPRASVYALSLLLHLLLAPFLIHDWDGYVFVKTAEDFLAGRSPYATVESQPSYIYVGDGVPVVNSWYAYPPVALLLMAPFFAATTFLLGAAPWVERLGVKLPLILGDLALAFAAAGLVRAALREEPEKAERRARTVERVLLLNPFLIFISAAWGMFDAWMMAFLVGSLWAIAERRPMLAGASMALAVLVKPFPALLLPIVGAYAWRSLGARGLGRWMAGGAVTGLAVCLPFFLDAPQGFLQQVVLNHSSRPPQGFTLVGVPLAFGWINGHLGTSLPADVTPEAISRWSFLLLLCVLALVWAQAGGARTPGDAVRLSLVAVAGTLLVSKVVNEQYFVMPLALAAIAFALAQRPLDLWVRRLYTFGGVVSGLLLGYHFFTFLPVDVAYALFDDPLAVVPRLTGALGWDAEEAFVYPTLLAAASLVPAMAASVLLVGGQALAPLRHLRARSWRAARPPPAAVAVLLVLLLGAPLSAAVLSASPAPDPAEGYAQPEGPLVGAYYYLWWRNPAHDPDLRYGNWAQGVTHVPLEGYYSTTAGKVRGDFRAMKANGIDVAVFSYHGGDDWPKLPALVRLGAETGVAVAPTVETYELVRDPAHRPRGAGGEPLGEEAGLSLRNATRDALVERILHPLTGFSHFPSWYRMDGEPVVFVRPTHLAFHDLDGEVRERLVDAALRLAEADAAEGRAPPAPAREALEATFPETPDELHRPGAALWRRAYHEVARAFWTEVDRMVDERHGPVRLVAGLTWDPGHGAERGASLGLARLNASGPTFVSTPTDVWQGHLGDAYDAQVRRWKDATLIEAQAARATGAPLVVSVTPGHDDRALRGEAGYVLPHENNGTLTYDLMWAHAKALRPDLVLVDSWNNFRAGNGVEPTHERADLYLARTAAHAADLKAQGPRPAPEMLLITNYLGATYHNDSGDPDGSLAFSLRLARAAEAHMPGRVAAADWNGPTLNGTDLSRHPLVVVEPGSKWPLTRDAVGLIDQLRNHSSAGGKVLLLGSDVGVHYARLVRWTEPPILGERLTLETPAGDVALPLTPWTKLHHVPKDARVLLWMSDGHERLPALWEVDVGNGTLAVTAFRPQGVDDATDLGPEVFALVIERARRGEAIP